MALERKVRFKSLCWLAKISLFVLVLACFSGEAFAKPSKGVWWWNAPDAVNAKRAAAKLQFLAAHDVNEIYFCADLAKYGKETRTFVKAARRKGLRVALLAGDVSWIYPGNRGFAQTLEAYLSYQRRAAPNERFYALHLDVEPHQDRKLSDERKWQLYADFVLRAAADVHAAGEKIEWDIPFWLDTIRVAFGERKDVSLLEVVMGASDCVALMSYRDTANAILDISKEEIAIANKGGVRVVLGAETGETGEGDVVTFFEEGASYMDAELAKVMQALESVNVPAGTGIAVHHFGSWEKLAGKENVK